VIDLDKFPVTHNSAAQQFQMTVDGHFAVLTYHQSGKVISLDHTGVPRAIGSQGVAAKLTCAALDFARSEKLRVVPSCSYADAYIRKHPQYRDLVATTDL
jgi:predicted GNAT family acetyltransferase